MSIFIPDDEPQQIVCTGEAGSNVWSPAFGYWEADEFGLDSDQEVGQGGRLYVNRRLYDAQAAEIERLEAIVEVLAAKASAARWNVTEDGALVRLCRGEHEKSDACTGHEELFVPLARAAAAEAERDALLEALTDLHRSVRVCVVQNFRSPVDVENLCESETRARAALAKTEGRK